MQNEVSISTASKEPKQTHTHTHYENITSNIFVGSKNITQNLNTQALLNARVTTACLHMHAVILEIKA